MEKEKLKKLALKLTSDRNNYMSAFRHNLDMYIAEKDITIRELSEEADIPYSTLNTFVYGQSRDCNLSTAVKLSRALQISIDELVGAETVLPVARETMGLYRNLSESDKYLARWFVNYLMNLSAEEENKHNKVSIMELEFDNGTLRLTSQYHRADISKISKEIRPKIFFGITMPCDHYMPIYSPYETLLIANDRKPLNNENCLIRENKNVFIVKCKIENGEMKFYSIRDGKFRLNIDEVDEVVGYVAATIIEGKKEGGN